MKRAPIILFVYNRLRHLTLTIEALKNNLYANESPLYIFSDGPKDESDNYRVSKVRDYITKINGFKNVEIITHRNNIGLATSVINGVSKVIKNYSAVIVLEDDIITSPYFLSFMNSALTYYANHRLVFSVTGFNHSPFIMKFPKYYNYDVFLNQRASSWGWGTWRDRWEKVDWDVKDYLTLLINKNFKVSYNISGNDKFEMLINQLIGKIDSWAIRWDLFHYKNNAGCVYPVFSYLNNIGIDGTGTHCKPKKLFYYENDLTLSKNKFVLMKNIYFDNKIIHNYARIYNKRKIDRLSLVIVVLISFLQKKLILIHNLLKQ